MLIAYVYAQACGTDFFVVLDFLLMLCFIRKSAIGNDKFVVVVIIVSQADNRL